jgi:hypothetical protein
MENILVLILGIFKYIARYKLTFCLWMTPFLFLNIRPPFNSPQGGKIAFFLTPSPLGEGWDGGQLNRKKFL